MIKAFILFSFLTLGFMTGTTAHAQTSGSIKSVALQIADEIQAFDHTQSSRVTAYLVINSVHKSVGLGIGPQVSQYLIWTPDQITDEVILFQISDLITNGLKRNPPLRITKPAYDKLVALLATLKNSRL